MKLLLPMLVALLTAVFSPTDCNGQAAKQLGAHEPADQKQIPVVQHRDEPFGNDGECLSTGEDGYYRMGEDGYHRILGVRLNQLKTSYIVGSKIPATIHIKNHGPPKTGQPPEHPDAQLFPHVTVWVKQGSKFVPESIRLPILNRILIKHGATFKRTIDLSKLKVFAKPGEYKVAVGHENGVVTDLGDWTGTLRTRPKTIVIKPKK